MKLLLDECVPKRLKNDFRDHDVRTVDETGLKGVVNGELLRAAVALEFDVLITVDQHIQFQQNISQLNLAVFVLIAMPCRYPQLKSLIPKVLENLKTIKPGTIQIIRL